jgi:hypothetical protein
LLKAIKAMPQLNEHLLEEVVSLGAALCKHEAHGVDSATMFPNDICKFFLLLCHSFSLVVNRSLLQSILLIRRTTPYVYYKNTKKNFSAEFSEGYTWSISRFSPFVLLRFRGIIHIFAYK